MNGVPDTIHVRVAIYDKEQGTITPRFVQYVRVLGNRFQWFLYNLGDDRWMRFKVFERFCCHPKIFSPKRMRPLSHSLFMMPN